MGGAPCGLCLLTEHIATTTQSTSLPPTPLAPPAPASAPDENGGKANRKSAKDGAWDKGVDGEDVTEF